MCCGYVCKGLSKLTDVGRPSPLWAAPFPRLGSRTVYEWRNQNEQSKQAGNVLCLFLSACHCGYNVTSCLKLLPWCPHNHGLWPGITNWNNPLFSCKLLLLFSLFTFQMFSPFHVSPPETPISSFLLPLWGCSPIHPLPSSCPSIPLHWGIKHPQDQGALLPLMPHKAILCYIWYSWVLRYYCVQFSEEPPDWFPE